MAIDSEIVDLLSAVTQLESEDVNVNVLKINCEESCPNVINILEICIY